MTRAIKVLGINTLAFTVCFAAWTMNGVLVTFFVSHGLYAWDATEIGWLIAVPILVGSLTRLPVGILTDRYGGRAVFAALMLISALALLLASLADNFVHFLLAGLGIGLSGSSFAVGVAYTSLFFPKERQGTALGIFGIGNIGAGITSLGGPLLLSSLTNEGRFLDGWRALPQLYAAILLVTVLLFFVLTSAKRTPVGKEKGLRERLTPLKNLRVWRFGLYYFYLFGGFVALAQWLVPYFTKGYGLSLKEAGLFAALFSLPCGIIRAFGGWISDHWGARRVLYIVFGGSLLCSLLLSLPRLDLILFVPLVFLMGILMGIGMGAVYKHIPSYFPQEVGIIGGLVGVIGGLGGFFLPIVLGGLLKKTGLWNTGWVFFSLLGAACLTWMHWVVRDLVAEDRQTMLEATHA